MLLGGKENLYIGFLLITLYLFHPTWRGHDVLLESETKTVEQHLFISALPSHPANHQMKGMITTVYSRM